MKQHKLVVWVSGAVLLSLAALVAYAVESKEKHSREFREQFVKSFQRSRLNTTVGDAMMLRILVESARAKRGIEVGSATGFGAINMGIAFERTGGHLYTLEIDPKMVKACRENLKKVGLENVVTCIEGDALKTLPKLEGQFDFVFIDAVKQDYLKYLKLIEPKLKPGAVIVGDNVIRSENAMKDFLDYIQNSPSYDTVIIRASMEKRDGMSISYKIRDSSSKSRWISLFNGEDLEGWKVKITGHELNDNYGNTFRVENGILKVSYDQYDKFDGKFGHLFYKDKFSHYKLRLEYRFVGEQSPGGPGWAFRNSGIMMHCQRPESMRKDQSFPVSIEVQLLGGNGRDKRPTGNVCTPGTNIVMDGKLVTQHCIPSASKTYHGDQWVTMEVEVHGNSIIKHIVNGQVVLEYEKPQLDEKDADARKLIKNGDKMLSEGYISLQSESHPVEFRKVELLRLKE